jgi:hypothetical protein
VAASNSGRSPSFGFPNCPRPQLPASHLSQRQLSTGSIKPKSNLCYDRRSVGQSVWGRRPDFCYCQTVAGLLMWGAVSDETTGVIYNYCWSSPAQSFSGPSAAGLMTTFYCLRFETLGTSRVRCPYFLVILKVGKKSVRPFTQLIQSNYLVLVICPGTDRTENVSSIIACSLVAGETTCPQSCSIAMAIVLSPVYTAVTWQRVFMSQYVASNVGMSAELKGFGRNRSWTNRDIIPALPWTD